MAASSNLFLIRQVINWQHADLSRLDGKKNFNFTSQSDDIMLLSPSDGNSRMM